MRDILLLHQAAEELSIPLGFLKLTKEGIVLVEYPMIKLGDPAKVLVIRDKNNIGHLVSDLKADIHFVINPATPFKDKGKRLFSIKHNMVSAFLNMVELKNYYPQLEIFMPEGIVDIKPGLFYPQTMELNDHSRFLGKKYIPPFANELGDQFGITYQIKPPHGKNTYAHTIIYGKNK